MFDFNTSLYRILGERIKKMRMEMDMSQDALANSVGLGRTSITNIELGKHNVSLPILYKIPEVLKVDLHFILPTHEEVAFLSNAKSETAEKTSNLNNILNSKQIDEKSLNTLKDILIKL
jgi:transcriptional regulator with XRE-family HTH domain